jgi:hypothetical protein
MNRDDEARLAEALLENEALTADLDDDLAQAYYDWALATLPQILAHEDEELQAEAWAAAQRVPGLLAAKELQTLAATLAQVAAGMDQPHPDAWAAFSIALHQAGADDSRQDQAI